MRSDAHTLSVDPGRADRGDKYSNLSERVEYQYMSFIVHRFRKPIPRLRSTAYGANGKTKYV